MSDQHLEAEDEVQLGQVVTESPLDNGSSALAALAQQRNALATTRETYLPIPGYERSGIALYVKYRLVDGDEIAKIGRKVTGEFRRSQAYERQLWASVDVMIAGCEGLFVDLGDRKKIPLKTNAGTEVSGFNADLAEALGFAGEINPNQPARSVVLGVFGGNMVALQQHALLLGRWMSDTTADVTQEFLEAGGNL
jgi:hypothetical protein